MALIVSSANFGSANSNKTLSRADNMGITHQNVTISFWVKLDAEISSGTQTFFTIRTTGGGTNYIDWYISYDYNGGTRRLRFGRSKPGIADQSVTYTVTLGTSNWHMIALKYDTATLKGWYDGAEVASGAASGTGSAGANSFVMGSLSGGSEYYSGLIDDFRIFNAVRADGTLATDYSSPSELVGNETNLQAYYTFNSDIVTDLTSNARTLTNNNGVTRYIAPFTLSDTVSLSETFKESLSTRITDVSSVSENNAMEKKIYFNESKSAESSWTNEDKT